MSHRHERTTGHRRLRSVLVALTLILPGAGCSKGSSDSVSADTTTTTTKVSTTTTLDAHEQGVRYADCMRQHGVPHFPDPEASGEFPSFGIDVSPEQWVNTVEACKVLQPASVDYSGEMSPAQLSAALRFAQCVRDHGVKDFPDPVSGEPLIDTTKIPSSDSEGGMAILDAATNECGDLLDEAG